MLNEDTTKLPLCVDMDGTLVKTDLMLESILNVAKNHFWFLFSLFGTLVFKGLPTFKIRLFEQANLDLKTLPYHQELMKYLESERARGRRLILATASSQIMAERVAAHLGIFDQVIGSGPTINISGTAKGVRLDAEFGPKKYVYAGNAWVDMKVWRAAGGAVVVHAPPKLAPAARTVGPVEAVFPRQHSNLKMVLKAMRLHQWAKNILVLAPLILAHRVLDFTLLGRTLLGMFAFMIMSSSVYVLNDLLDLDADRRHPDNRRRPFASGELPLGLGFVLAPVLALAGAAMAAVLSWQFLCVLLGYYILTFLYSMRLKQVVLADVMILAALYTWRILAGSFTANVAISAWLMTFSGFFFLSLALIKRSAELILSAAHDLPPNKRRGYSAGDLGLLISLGSAAGYISVLVLALYINSDLVARLYQRPMAMWLVCPFLLYWLSRMWLKAHRGLMTSDPLVFALKDRVSYFILGCVAMIWALATGVV